MNAVPFALHLSFFICILVIGALLGTQDGRNIEIFNSFELQFDLFDDGQIVINMEYYKTKEEQCTLTWPCLTEHCFHLHFSVSCGFKLSSLLGAPKYIQQKRQSRKFRPQAITLPEHYPVYIA